MASASTRVGVRELRRDLSAWLRRAANGEPIAVTSRDRVIVEIKAPETTSLPRKAGALKGQIWMADDFDKWPDGFLDFVDRDIDDFSEPR